MFISLVTELQSGRCCNGVNTIMNSVVILLFEHARHLFKHKDT